MRKIIETGEYVLRLGRHGTLRYFGILTLVAMAVAVIAISPASPTTHTVEAQTLSVCDRTPVVRDKIVAILLELEPMTTCTNADAGLPNVTELDLSNSDITEFQARDLEGLNNLMSLDISDNQLSSLPSNFFNTLDELMTLDFSNNNIGELPNDFFGSSFGGKDKVTSIDASDNRIRSIGGSAFDGFTALVDLNIADNHVSSLPGSLFNDLDALVTLDISNNNLTALPNDFFGSSFDGKTTVTTINASGNRITSVGDNVFDGFDVLTKIDLARNDIGSLTLGTFDDLDTLVELNLPYNDLETLPAGIFDKLTVDGMSCDRSSTGGSALPNANDNFETLDLQRNNLNSLPDGVFDCLRPLKNLYLNHNNLTALPDGVFRWNENIEWLNLESNGLAALPEEVFTKAVNVEILDLSDNRLTSVDNADLHNTNNASSIIELDISNNLLTQLPDEFVDSFMRSGERTDVGYCLLNFDMGGNPFSEEWIKSGKFNEFLTYFGRYDPRGTGECGLSTRYPDSEAKRGTNFIYRGATTGDRARSHTRVTHQNVTGIEALGVAGIDMSHTVTGTGKSSWELLLEKLEDPSATHFIEMFDLSFGYEGLLVDNALWHKLPLQLERITIKDATISDNISTGSGQGFARFAPERISQEYNRFDNIIYKHNLNDDDDITTRRPAHLYWGRWPIDTFEGYDTWFLDRGTGLQSLTLDNVGLTGTGQGVLNKLPAGTLRWLEIRNNPELTEIHSHIGTLSNLYGLQIENNGITTVKTDTFSGLSSKLFYLGLGGNEIASIEAGAFNGLDELQMLLLNDNELSNLDSNTLMGLKKLENLYLQNNDITALPSKFFTAVDRSESSERLEQLNLDGNPGTPFHLNFNVEDHESDTTKKTIKIPAGAAYAFEFDVLNMDETIAETVIVNDGTFELDVDFPTDGSIAFLSMHPYHANAGNRYCLGLDECYAGFEFKLNPPARLMVVQTTSEVRLYEIGESVAFQARFSEDVSVDGSPALSFTIGDMGEERQARFTGQPEPNTLNFEYTVETQDLGLTGVDTSSSSIQAATITGTDGQEAVTTVQGISAPAAGIAFISERPVIDPDTGVLVTTAEITRIEPSIRSVFLRSGETIRVNINAFGLQDLPDNGLLDGVTITWDDNNAGGSFDGTGTRVVYTAPSVPGVFTLTASVGTRDCIENTDELECTATFEVTVRRASAEQPEEAPPVNPSGVIPTILTDNRGNNYEVFTPVDGGSFDAGEGFSITASAGDVPNGEIIGVRMSEGGAASNLGMTHQRYSLGGNMYEIHVVDSAGASVDAYVLDQPAEVCIPLPAALSANISKIAMVALNSDDTLTILSAKTRIGGSSTSVCGNVSNLPATVAVGTQGAPEAIPTPTPAPEPTTPDTGATAPSTQAALWAMLLGIAIATVAVGTMLRARRRKLN